jgi:hypothetical protein
MEVHKDGLRFDCWLQEYLVVLLAGMYVCVVLLRVINQQQVAGQSLCSST